MSEAPEKKSTGPSYADMVSDEQAYRRGWHQGWVYAVDMIVDGLLEQGVPLTEIRRLVMLFEDERIKPWRAGSIELATLNTPIFQMIDYPPQREVTEEDGEVA